MKIELKAIPVLKMGSLSSFTEAEIRVLTDGKPQPDALEVFEMLDGLFPEDPSNN